MSNEDKIVEVAPALEMDAETLTKHLNARHSEPFEDVGLQTVDAHTGDIKVWQAYHSREHRVYDDHDHFHRGEGDDGPGQPEPDEP